MRIRTWLTCVVLSLAVVSTVNAQGRRGPGGPGGRGGNMFDNGLVALASRDYIQKDLGISTDDAAQVKKVVDQYNDAFRDAMGERPDFREMSSEERQKYMAKSAEAAKELNTKFVPKLKDVLTSDQFKRLEQIRLQELGSNAYLEENVVKDLSLTKEQQDKIKALNKEYEEKRNEMFRGGGGGDGRERFEKLREDGQQRDKNVQAVLTKEQTDKFASLTGKKLERPEFGGRGNRGGNGGDGGARPKRPQPKAE